MPDYDRFRATAQRLISDFGSKGTAQITRRVPGTYDPIADTDSGQVMETQTCECVVLPVSQADQTKKLDDPAVSEQVKILISELQIAWPPTPDDTVVLPQRSGHFTITDAKPVAPDGAGIVWILLADKVADV